MKTDYKFWFIERNDNGFITRAGIRFYEGDLQTVAGLDIASGAVTSSTKYVRSKKLTATDLSHLGSTNFLTAQDGTDAVLYNISHFGAISTDDDLRRFLNKELKKDKNRIPINEQTVIV